MCSRVKYSQSRRNLSYHRDKIWKLSMAIARRNNTWQFEITCTNVCGFADFFLTEFLNRFAHFLLNGELLSHDTRPPCYLRVTSEIARRIMRGIFIGRLIKRREKKLHNHGCVTRTSHGVNTSAAVDTPLSGVRHAFPHYQSLPGTSIPFNHPPTTYSRSVFPSYRNSSSVEHRRDEWEEDNARRCVRQIELEKCAFLDGPAVAIDLASRWNLKWKIQWHARKQLITV